MTDMVLQKNVASLLTLRPASGFVSVTAGGAGDAVAVNGIIIQRSLIGMPYNAALVLAYTTTLSASQSLSFTVAKIQDSADGVTFADYQAFAAPGSVATGAGTVQSVVELAADLRGARDYIRAVFTPDLSAGATDTATIIGLWAFAGFDRLPSPN